MEKLENGRLEHPETIQGESASKTRRWRTVGRGGMWARQGDEKRARHIRCGVENPAGQHEAACDGFLTYLLICEMDAVELSIVRSVYEDIVDACHASIQWDQG